MAIRRYGNADREALMNITAVCFEGLSVDHAIEELCGPIAGMDWVSRKTLQVGDDVSKYPAGIFVAEEGGDVVGFITTRVDRARGIGSIPDLAVLPAHRRKGLASKLIDAAIAHLRGESMEYVRIDTLDQNEIGKYFYPKRGFKHVATAIHYIMRVGEA